uniref:MFS domain-containing protein n=1 Tax=Panagrellus redivivus TaxID=6233 RepID=A0A7E4W693_PANRE
MPGQDVPAVINSDPSRSRRFFGKLGKWLFLDTHNKRVMWILFLANLINYMDRFTIAGVLTKIKEDFDLNDQKAGLLQTSFLIAYLITAPIFGYLSDRWNRKYLIMIGMSIWLFAVIGGSFVPAGMNYLFFISRAAVGIGEASYGVIVPTMIADMFAGNTRSKVFMFFYIAIPVGSGLGYGVGSAITAVTKSWRWGMRATPAIGFFVLALTGIVVRDPPRGQSDAMHTDPTTLWADVKYLGKRKTFWFATGACTMNFFMIGALSWWTPTITKYAYAAQNGGAVPPEVEAELGVTFGAVTCIAGLIGVTIGTAISGYCRKLVVSESTLYKGADPFICGAACFFALPMLIIALKVFEISLTVGWIFAFLAITCLCVPWAVNTDIVMRTVLPHRRGIANAIMTSVSHLLGDACSPYLVGVVSDALMNLYKDDTAAGHYTALQYALLIATLTLIFATALYVCASYTMGSCLNEFEQATHYAPLNSLPVDSMPHMDQPVVERRVVSNALNDAPDHIRIESAAGSSDPLVTRNSAEPSRGPSGSTEHITPTNTTVADKSVKEVRKSKAKTSVCDSDEDRPITLDGQIIPDTTDEAGPMMLTKRRSHHLVDVTQVGTERTDGTQRTSVDTTQVE